MTEPSPDLRELAQRLLAYEAGGREQPEELSAAAERVCQGLYRQISPLVGSLGFGVLFSRALKQARAEFPFLEGVGSEAQAGQCLRGLPESVRERDPGEANRAVVAIIADFLELLANFIGPDLSMRLVYQSWPEVRPVQAASGVEGTHDE